MIGRAQKAFFTKPHRLMTQSQKVLVNEANAAWNTLENGNFRRSIERVKGQAVIRYYDGQNQVGAVTVHQGPRAGKGRRRYLSLHVQQGATEHRLHQVLPCNPLRALGLAISNNIMTSMARGIREEYVDHRRGRIDVRRIQNHRTVAGEEVRWSADQKLLSVKNLAER
jgi:hypothetical protein